MSPPKSDKGRGKGGKGAKRASTGAAAGRGRRRKDPVTDAAEALAAAVDALATDEPVPDESPSSEPARVAEPAGAAADTGPLQRFMDRLGTPAESQLARTPGTGNAAYDAAQAGAAPASQAPKATQPSYPVPAMATPIVVAAMRPRVGEILTQARRMALGNVEVVLKQQSQAGGRFGEVAIAMGVLDASDLLWALSQQSGLGRPELRSAGMLAGASAELIVVREPNSAAAEFIRNMRSQLLGGVFAAAAATRRALAVVSADAGDGKTYLAANLALSFAQLGGRTMLIDADLRAPRLQRLFGTDTVGGLAGVLDGSELLRDAVASLPDLPNLHLLAGGPSQRSPLELLEQPAATVLVETLTREYEHVIVDTAAASCGADMRVVAQCCGAAVVVARKGRSRMDDVQGLVAQLQQSGVALAGLVMNRH